MSVDDILIDIEEIIGDQKPQYIPIDKCNTGKVQARQSGTEVKEDSKLVSQIRRAGGLLHPVILKDTKDGEYEIIVGQRRTGAYHILRKENPKFDKIRSYVIERDLSEDEIRVISFIENFGRDDMDRNDYINVIDYFYQKYGGKTGAAKALGISTSTVKKYLTYSRLHPPVKKCIDNKEFSIDVALKALKGLGDDEDSVNDDELIETARILKSLKPMKRAKAVDKMQKKKISAKEAAEGLADTTPMTVDVTDDAMERLGKYKDKHGYEDEETAAVEAMDTELFRDLGETSN